jgi:hypothetical protein
MDVGQVYTFKLNSGEEVIAKVVADNGSSVDVETPVSVAPGPQGMGLIQSLFTADPDQKIQINMNCVAIHALTDDGVKMKYIEATTGIKVPDKKIIMG